MRLIRITTARFAVPILAIFVILGQGVASPARDEATKLLPENIGRFRRLSLPKVDGYRPETNEFVAKTEYSLPGGGRARVSLDRQQQDGKAYELLTTTAQELSEKAEIQFTASLGTAGFASPDQVVFFKGPFVVRIWGAAGKIRQQDLVELANQLAEKLERGDGEIPPLIKHLPDWEKAQNTAIYLNRFRSLESVADDSVLNVIATDGDADAVLAKYGQMRLLIIEFNTPQRASENDRLIVGRIRELWNSGEPAPSAYRRIGNYSVFVFDAPSEQGAKELLDKVQYEQVVSWLGENPNILKEAERQYVRTTLGVLIMVLKASGVVLITCFASGALFGMLLFSRRRAQQRASEAFSDAGGMLRLNLDEMTPQTNPARLIGPR